jgi:penicillin G amidase
VADASYGWQQFIPQNENPHALNPERGFLESANQRPVDTAYPYFIPGSYITPRGMAIEHFLSDMTGITTDDMMKLQNSYFNILARDVRPILLQYVKEDELNADAKRYLDIVKSWDLMAGPSSKGQTIYQCWWDSVNTAIWQDDISRSNPASPWPEEQTTMELLKKDPNLPFIDNLNTTKIETLDDAVTAALNQASVDLALKEKEGKLEWSKFKNPTIYHLIKDLAPFGKTGLNAGGDGNIINAMTHSHGPSWRMVVQLSAITEPYGVYPGGQSGNPGSKYYDNFVDTWLRGEYYRLWFMKKSDAIDNNVKWIMRFEKK